MNLRAELESGVAVATRPGVPEPGDFDSFYACATELSGAAQFWCLLTQLMAAADRPVCAVHEMVAPAENPGVLPQPSLPELLRRRGYGFGIVSDVDLLPGEVVAGESAKLLFVRDPRYVLVAHYSQLARAGASASRTPDPGALEENSAPASFAEFLRLPLIEQVNRRYQRLAHFWRSERNTVLLRYEHARSGWESIAAEVVAALKLPIDVATVTSIAGTVAPVGDRLAESDRPPPAEVEDMETLLGAALDAFGYVKRVLRRRQAQQSEATTRQRSSQVSDLREQAGAGQPDGSGGAGSTDNAYPVSVGIFEPDPVLHGRLRRNSYSEMTVLGRRVVLDVDESGCRPVIGQPAEGEKTLAVYGCSFTYGIAIPAEETFCSLLQEMFPTWRVENHGVAGYSTSRNLIQLERAVRWAQPELVTFCWIAHHLGRNVGSLPWIQSTSSNIPRAPQGETPRRPFPRAGLDPDGALRMGSIKVPRHDLLGLDFSDFAADPYYLDLVCLRLFERANQLVTGYGGHFFVTTLQGNLSDGMTRRLAAGGIPVVDASLNGKEYLCLPDDPHPNTLANRIYAQRMRDYLMQFTGQ